MAKPTYKILSDNPYQDAYGQYVFNADQNEFWDITGLNTIEQGDDLYTTYYNELTVPYNYVTPFDSFGGPSNDSDARIDMELYYMIISDTNIMGTVIYLQWKQELYITEGNYDQLVSESSGYSDLSTWLDRGNRSAFWKAHKKFHLITEESLLHKFFLLAYLPNLRKICLILLLIDKKFHFFLRHQLKIFAINFLFLFLPRDLFGNEHKFLFYLFSQLQVQFR